MAPVIGLTKTATPWTKRAFVAAPDFAMTDYGDGTLYPRFFEANRDVLEDPQRIRSARSFAFA